MIFLRFCLFASVYLTIFFYPDYSVNSKGLCIADSLTCTTPSVVDTRAMTFRTNISKPCCAIGVAAPGISECCIEGSEVNVVVMCKVYVLERERERERFSKKASKKGGCAWFHCCVSHSRTGAATASHEIFKGCECCAIFNRLTPLYIYIYIYIYTCVCAHVCVMISLMLVGF